MIESLDVMLWGKKAGTLVSSRESHRNKACFYFDKEFVSGGYDIKAAEPFIKKAVETVSNYAEYARKAGIGEAWIGMIEQEIAARVECLDGKDKKG